MALNTLLTLLCPRPGLCDSPPAWPEPAQVPLDTSRPPRLPVESPEDLRVAIPLLGVTGWQSPAQKEPLRLQTAEATSPPAPSPELVLTKLVPRLPAGATGRHDHHWLVTTKARQQSAGMQQCCVDPIDGWILSRRWFHEKMP